MELLRKQVLGSTFHQDPFSRVLMKRRQWPILLGMFHTKPIEPNSIQHIPKEGK